LRPRPPNGVPTHVVCTCKRLHYERDRVASARTTVPTSPSLLDIVAATRIATPHNQTQSSIELFTGLRGQIDQVTSLARSRACLSCRVDKTNNGCSSVAGLNTCISGPKRHGCLLGEVLYSPPPYAFSGQPTSKDAVFWATHRALRSAELRIGCRM
jgi:hypothetical protein